MYDKKIEKKSELNNQASMLDVEKSERQERMKKINEIFLNVQSFLMPSLQAYLNSFKRLQDILLQFH